MTLWIYLGVVGLILARLNALSTLRLWRSSQYERGQKITQTLLTWMVPGFALVVMYMLGHDRRESAGGDPTISDPGINPWIVSGPPSPPSAGGDGHH